MTAKPRKATGNKAPDKPPAPTFDPGTAPEAPPSPTVKSADVAVSGSGPIRPPELAQPASAESDAHCGNCNATYTKCDASGCGQRREPGWRSAEYAGVSAPASGQSPDNAGQSPDGDGEDITGWHATVHDVVITYGNPPSEQPVTGLGESPAPGTVAHEALTAQVAVQAGPPPVFAGTFAIYEDGTGGYVLVVQHEDGSTDRKHIPSAMVKLAQSGFMEKMTGSGGGFLGKLIGR